MALNVNALAGSVLAAMRGVLNAKWPELKTYATSEAKRLAQGFAQIVALKTSGQIDETGAAVLLEMHKNSTRQVLLTVEGMGLVLTEQAINASIAAVRGAINNAIGFALL